LGNDATSSDGDRPQMVNRLGAVTAISAGTFDSLALMSNGTVMAWGQNIYGDLGDGTSADTNVPTAVCAVGATPPCSAAAGNALSGVTAISAGGFHALALLTDGTVVAWGDNVDGEVGDGSATATGVDVPVPVRGLGSVTAISSGGDHSLALLRNGTVKAWGADGHGQLGDGRFGRHSLVAVPVTGLAGVSAISAGAFHSLALLRSGVAMAWGSNSRGQLGDGAMGKDHDLAHAVTGLSGVTAISAGAFDNLALVSDGTVVSWGSNEWGALGFPAAQGASSDAPVAVPGLGAVSAICAGGYHNLVELS
jgi:alpha-tubulin suppressor-like RCC1 family protein